MDWAGGVFAVLLVYDPRIFLADALIEEYFPLRPLHLDLKMEVVSEVE
jgi:hypothetical protein